MKKIFVISALIGLVVIFAACYKNRYDVSEFTRDSIMTVSLTKDVAPILTSGGCGCHNGANTTRQFMFSYKDTIYYETMVSKSPMLLKMANGEAHPAEGTVIFTPSQASLVKKWVEQGAKNDALPPVISGPITYSQHIVPLYKQNCTGGSCHGGGLAPVLDYTSMKLHEGKIRTMMNSLGREGHRPTVPISQGTATTFIAWMDGGFKP